MDIGYQTTPVCLLLRRFAAAVPHAAVVEPQCGDAGRGKRTAQQHELPVAAGPLLRTAYHDHDTQRGGGFGDAQHTDQCGSGSSPGARQKREMHHPPIAAGEQAPRQLAQACLP